MRKTKSRQSNEPARVTYRLNHYIASCGAASRRRADEWIAEGRVQVNGKTVYELGVKVDPKTAKVTVDHKPISLDLRKKYILFHKPKNVVVSMSDPEGRPTVADYMGDIRGRVYPVGRLDWESEGLILLTNDGDFALRASHPRYGVQKTYLAKVNGEPSPAQIDRLLKGVTIPGGHVSALAVERVRSRSSEDKSWLRIIIGEGKNRQVRKMFEKIGFDVLKLQRIAIGRLKAPGLQRGQWVELDQEDLERVFMPAQGTLPRVRRGTPPSKKNAKSVEPAPVTKRKKPPVRKVSPR